MSSPLHQSASNTRRPDRAGTRRLTVNVPLLLGTVVLIAIAVPALYFWHKYRADATASTFKGRAEALVREADYDGAVSYYQKFLLTKPDDVEALLGLIDAYSHGERNRNRLEQLNQLISRGLGRAPDEHHLRVTLAENLLDLGSFQEASDEAAKVLDAAEVLEASPEREQVAEKHKLAAQKVMALAKFALTEIDPSISRSEAIGKMLTVAEQLPGDVKLVVWTAQALRQNPTVETLVDIDAATKADELMDRLVDKNPDDVMVRLARHDYRAKYRLPDAEQDLARALELDPENIEALLLSAEPGSGTANATDAEREPTLRRVIELAPKDGRGYLALAAVLTEQGKTDEAIDLLVSGRAMVDDNHKIELGLALANAQLNAERFDAAKSTIAEAESESALVLARMPAGKRELVTNALRLLEARYAVSQGDLELAITRLTSVVVSAQGSSHQSRSPQWASATLMLARLHTQAGRPDRASEHWDALSKAFPGDLLIASESVNASLSTGNPQAAIQRIEDFARSGELSPELMVRRVLAHLSFQLVARKADERNWKEFESALAAAKLANEASVDLTFAEVQYLLVLGNKPAAVAILREKEEAFADNAAFWRAAVMAYHRLGEAADVARALDKHEETSASLVDDARLRTLILVSQQDFANAEKLLTSLDATANEQEQRELLLMRAEVLRVSGDHAAALKLIEQAVQAGEPTERLLTLGIDTALALGKLETAQQWEEQLAKKTENGFEARLARARRLTISWEKLNIGQRQNLVRLVSDLRGERPGSHPIVTLSAHLARLNGDSRRALEDYQRAIELGDRQPSVLQHVIMLLYEAGRFEEVERYMAMVASDEASTPFFDLMKIDVAARQGNNEVALQLAQEGVDRNPQDVERRLYLGSLLLRAGDAKQAVEVLQQAAKDFPNDNRVWPALFNAYVRSDQVEFARKALGRLTTSSLLSVERRHFVAGQGYEIIGDPAQAEEQYKLTLAAQPTAVEARLRYATLLSRRSPREAQAEFQQVLQLDPTNVAAQRQLAVLLATSGNAGDWQRANELLSATSGSSEGDAATNDRLRAILLSQQGRTRAERIANYRLARKIIEPLLERGNGQENDQNRQVLAEILQREAALSGDDSLLLAARDQFRAALNQGPPSASKLSGYIEFLLSAAKTLSDHPLEEGAEPTEADREAARQSVAFLSDADARLAELRRLRTEGDKGLEALVVALTARLELARGDQAGAKTTITRFVENNQNLDDLDDRQKAQRYLLFGQLYGVIESHAEAEQWYRRLMEQSPEAYLLVVESLIAQGKRTEAAKLGLEMAGSTPSPAAAKVLARIMTVTSDEIEIDPAVEQALASAIQSNQEDIELLQAEAVMRASRGDYGPAIATMRKILELDPNHSLTLNNLATLLAERPNQRAEALELIGRAIDVAGRNPMLLDTQGTIHLKLGDAKAAIASLEEATAGRATDARYYLHLAAAYELGGRDDDARRMLAEARAFGLENFVLTEDDRKMLTSLEESLPSEGSAPQ